MPTFKDTTGREWRVSLDVYALEQVESRTGVRIDRLLADKAAELDRISDSPVLLVRVLWVLVEEQARAVGVSPEQFGRSLGGDALEEAALAFMAAYRDFCPSRQRRVIDALAAKTREVVDLETTRALRQIEALSGSPTNSAAPAASTPAAAG